uniref:Uncharacterized protein n=1 Tax=Arundo donax TaxID=35708 RepID=A0A0A8YIX1_ARUDO
MGGLSYFFKSCLSQLPTYCTMALLIYRFMPAFSPLKSALFCKVRCPRVFF